MSLSKESLVATLFALKHTEDTSVDRKGGPKSSDSRTITSKFVAQLHILRTLLAGSDTRFVRCIKTNDRQVPDEACVYSQMKLLTIQPNLNISFFAHGQVNKSSILRQLICSGVMAALEVSTQFDIMGFVPGTRQCAQNRHLHCCFRFGGQDSQTECFSKIL